MFSVISKGVLYEFNSLHQGKIGRNTLNNAEIFPGMAQSATAQTQQNENTTYHAYIQIGKEPNKLP